MVGVELRVECIRGRVDRPEALAATIARRVGSQHGARLRGLLDEGVEPLDAAVAILREDLGPRCPVESCLALDARPITDPARCARRERCPFYVEAVEA